MEIAERATGDVMILDLKSKLTIGEGDEFLRDKINSLIQQGHRKLLLNLEGVPYVDSAGLGEIVRTYTTVNRQGGNLKLLNLTKRIQDLVGDHQAAHGLRHVRVGAGSSGELQGLKRSAGVLPTRAAWSATYCPIS